MTHKQDFIEWFRTTFYPPLHVVLEFFNFYAAGELNPDEYVGTVYISEEELERRFHDTGVVRNALAKYKSLPDGRSSTGSWRLTHATHPEFVDSGMQLHITLFENPDRPLNGAVDVYAHYEKDYGYDAIGHLKGEDYSSGKGVNMARDFLLNTMGLNLHKND